MLHAQGKQEEALQAMAAAADLEDRTEKHPVTPGPLVPARELYGAMLLADGKAKEALAAYQATQAKEPNRFHGYAGVAMAAEKVGDTAVAKANYTKLVALVSAPASGPQLASAATERPEVVAARQFLTKN
jgi:predicted Zn-dependent protease